MLSDQKYKLLAVSGNRDFLLVIKNYAERCQLFSNLEFAFNGREAIERFCVVRPDLMIIDMILPVIDGIGVLEQILEQRAKGKSKIIMVSGVSEDFFIRKSFESGADYILQKPIAYEAFYGRARDLLEKDEKDAPFVSLNGNGEEAYLPIITKVLLRLGLSPDLKGYSYARQAIRLVLEEPDMLKSITGRLYGAVAETNHTNTKCVERNIRHAIESAWSKGNLSYIEELFGYTVDAEKGKPTNAAFIATVADYININLLRID